MEAIVLAGGLGTRLLSIVSDVPKPMALVAERPFLQYVLDDLNDKGVKHVVIAVCYMKECIMDFFKNEYYKNIRIDYSIEDKPLCTGGAIKKALELCHEDYVIVVNGDTYFDVNLNDMSKEITLDINVLIAIKKMNKFSRYGEVKIDNEFYIVEFSEKKYCEDGFINGGIYIVKRNSLKKYPEKFSLENDYFHDLLVERKMKAYVSQGFFIDIGIPEDYKRAQKLFREKLY